MGQGNFLPSNNDYHYRMVYVENMFEDEFIYDDVKFVISSYLKDKNFNSTNEWIDDKELSLFESNLAQITIADNMWSIAVCVKSNPYLFDGWHPESNFSAKNVDYIAKGLFEHLKENWDLRVRCCAYTSAKYTDIESA